MGIEWSWAWAWLLLAAGLVVGEIFTAGFFLLPFGIGAAAAALTAWLGGSPTFQWATFVGVSIAVLVPLHRFAERVTQGSDLHVAGDRMLGRIGETLEVVPAGGFTGRVRVGSEEWRATTEGDEAILAGTRVEILGIDGTHLIVRPWKRQATDEDGGKR